MTLKQSNCPLSAISYLSSATKVTSSQTASQLAKLTNKAIVNNKINFYILKKLK